MSPNLLRAAARRLPSRHACPSRRRATLFALAVTAIGLGGPAGAVVGGAEAEGEALARSGVMILSSRGGVCSGVVIAKDIVLTAGHCAAGGAEYRVHYKQAGEPVLLPLAGRAVHPGYDAGAVAGRRRSIDLALIRTSGLPERFSPAALGTASPGAGASVTLGGYGVARPGDARSTGTFRTAALPVIEPYGPSRILIWLQGRGAGACEGDSGGPIASGGTVVAVTSWAKGEGKSPCGGISQGILVGPQRDWIDRTLAGWGAAARWE